MTPESRPHSASALGKAIRQRVIPDPRQVNLTHPQAALLPQHPLKEPPTARASHQASATVAGLGAAGVLLARGDPLGRAAAEDRKVPGVARVTPAAPVTDGEERRQEHRR